MALSVYDFYRCVQPGLRRKRIEVFLERLQPTVATRILDVGGYVYDWDGVVPVNCSVVLLNLSHPKNQAVAERFTCLAGDGRALEFADKSFDIAFSNSVIEHLGTFEDQKRFALELRRVGRRVFVQTPNRWFFIEPHFIVPFVHFLPWNLAKRLLRYFSLRAMLRKGDNADLDQLAKELRLLSFREMKRLFPGCEIYRERWFGFTKSFIAIGP
jgi:SAM-dependent methyltransferase